LAVEKTTIEAVRVMGSDGIGIEYRWDPDTWYLIRDDCPYLDFLIRGFPARARVEKEAESLQLLADSAPDGAKWQRWNLETDLARHRRLGEASLALKVPKNCTLRSYVIPTLLLSFPDVVAMVEDIEAELGVVAAWDMITERPERSWSRPRNDGRAATAQDLIRLVDEELRCAHAVRHDPFKELGPQSRRGLPLAENAVVSHWAMRRGGQLRRSADAVARDLNSVRSQEAKNNPSGRQTKIADELKRLVSLERELADLRGSLARIVNDLELMTVVYPSPLLQRDYRLRQLLRAFAPRFSETLSAVESSRSHYPPVLLNALWELWGAVWLAKEFRRLGFKGACSKEGADVLKSCSWRFEREDVVLVLDYEPTPVLVDHERLPPPHDRELPALEWAAQNQELDVDRPFFGSELSCSPDYTLRITTPRGKFLIVGDACLASPKHHGGKGPDKTGTKLHTVEHYRQTLGWAIDGQVVRCHPMGGFVVFPSPATAWTNFQQVPRVRDCTLLCPSPRGDPEASRRLANLLIVVAPEICQ
jgi:hypothetical protein